MRMGACVFLCANIVDAGQCWPNVGAGSNGHNRYPDQTGITVG